MGCNQVLQKGLFGFKIAGRAKRKCLLQPKVSFSIKKVLSFGWNIFLTFPDRSISEANSLQTQ